MIGTETGLIGTETGVPEACQGEAVRFVVLETLAPQERAVFVLHEVFGCTHREIGTMIGRTPGAVRQLARRARGHAEARRPRHPPDQMPHREATERLLRAALGGDVRGLVDTLAPDVTLWSDGGAAAPGARGPVRGRHRAVRLLAAAVAGRRPRSTEVRCRRVGGLPAALLYAGESPYALVHIELRPRDGRIGSVYVLTDPRKLGGRAVAVPPPGAASLI